MRERIPMASADLDDRDVAAVVEVIRSGRLALGPKTNAFERAVADYVGVEHAVAVSSGTAALHLIVSSLGLGPGDEVLVPSFTFAASVNAILFVGASPVFVEIEPETFTLDLEDLAAKCTERTRAVMVVDPFGHPAPWPQLEAFARDRGLLLIDDCCEALGAQIDGRAVGSFGDAGAFAFYPNKQITTGEGGIIVTNRDDVAEISRSLRNQGRGAMGAWLEHQRLGYNYRLDEMSAALGLSQLARLDEFLARRERVAAAYRERLAELPWVRPYPVRDGVRMSWFVFVVLLAPGIDRDAVMAAMAADGIPTRAYFSPIHTQPYIRERFGELQGSLPVTEEIANRTMALPFFNRLDDDGIELVVGALKRAVAAVGSATS